MPQVSELKALYEIGLNELLQSSTVISLETPQGYSLSDLIEQIRLDHATTSTSLKRALRRLKREFILWTHHIKREEKR